jgi:5-methylcytosine-specific restriction protein A
MPSAANQHKPFARAKRIKSDKERQDEHNAKYGRRWAKFRADFLRFCAVFRDERDRPVYWFCAWCKERPAAVVDHIDGFEGPDDPMRFKYENLQGLCGPCHWRKTAEIDGAMGNKPSAEAPKLLAMFRQEAIERTRLINDYVPV